MKNLNEEVNKDIYYNPSTLFSKDKLINFVVGERGNGKSYAFKRKCIKDYLKDKSQFIWIRRFNTEFDDIDLFFTDVGREFPNKTFSVGGGKFKMGKEVIGYYFPLTKAITKKSIPYPNVNKIIFDEFIVDKGHYHYLHKEVECFFDVVETIGRLRDVKCYLIANAISENNPYFTYFNITLTGRFTKVGCDIIVEKTESLHYREIKKDTRFGKVIANTDYGKYAINNEFVKDNHEFIEKRSESSKNIFNIIINDKTIGIWADFRESKLYCSFKFDPNMPNLALTTSEMKPNFLMLNSRSQNMKVLKNAIEMGYLYYESFKVKTYVQEIIKLMSIK